MNKPKVGSLFISPVCTSQIRLLPVSLVPIALPPSPNSRLIYPITWILWLDIENGYLKLTYPKDNFVSSPPNRGLSAFITISVMGSPPTLCINQKPMGPSKLCPWFVSYSTTICSPHTVSNQLFPIYTFKSMKYSLYTEEYIWYKTNVHVSTHSFRSWTLYAKKISDFLPHSKYKI